MVLLSLLHIVWQAVRHGLANADERFKRWSKPAAFTLLETSATDLNRTKPELIAETAFLRQQLIVLQRQVKQPTLTPLDRGLLVVLASRISIGKRRC